MKESAAAAAAGNGVEILGRKSIADIFSNLHDIIAVNQELMRRLTERIKGTTNDNTVVNGTSTSTTTTSTTTGDNHSSSYAWNPETDKLGDIFLKMAPYFKMYSIYVKNFNYALSAISLHMGKNAVFADFLKVKHKTKLLFRMVADFC